jgi:malate/lactate dehydrogenase
MQDTVYRHRKVTVVGTGMVGMSYAYALTIKGLVREIGLINRTAAKAEGRGHGFEPWAALREKDGYPRRWV